MSPRLIKIDVQGAEMLVRHGSAETLQQYAPAIFIELHEKGLQRFGTSVAAVIAFLLGLGYSPYWLARTGPDRLARAEDVRAEVVRLGYVDILFLKPARPDTEAPSPA